jgi:heme/copper-type cytochrome/quinol oxidase subunit 2
MVILSIFATAVISVITGYSIFLLHRVKNKLPLISGTIVSMSIAVMAGLLSGYMIGVLSGEMFLPVGIGMLTGFFIGFLAGQPIGLIAILSGAVSGLMSGIVGAILGAILQFENPVIMLGILIGLYVIVLGLVILYLLVERNEKLSLDTQSISPFTIFSAGLFLIALFLFLYSSDLVKFPGKSLATRTETTSNSTTSSVGETEIDVTKDAAPKIKMMVTPTGYTPNVIIVKKGVSVELEITNPNDNSCFSTFMIPDFNLNNVNLKIGTTNLTFTPDKTGEYTFSCGMNMFKGTVIVE